MSVTIYVGRHGETNLNSEDKLRGWIDVPLNADGVKEAEKMAQKMKKYPLDRIYSSDLDRADRTARIVAKEQDLKTIPRMWFRPIDFGQLNGKSIKDVKPQLDEILERWKTDPGFEAPGGESFEEFQERNLQGLEAVVRAAGDGEKIMIVAHLRNAKLFQAVAKNGGPLKGDTIEHMGEGEGHYHQSSGEVAHFEYNGHLVFKGKI